MFICVQLKAV